MQNVPPDIGTISGRASPPSGRAAVLLPTVILDLDSMMPHPTDRAPPSWRAPMLPPTPKCFAAFKESWLRNIALNRGLGGKLLHVVYARLIPTGHTPEFAVRWL